MASTVTELLRRRFGGKSLPYDAEIEYLQSSATQYINTGIKITSNFKSEIKGYFLQNRSRFDNLLGCTDDHSSGYGVPAAITTNNLFYAQFGNGTRLTGSSGLTVATLTTTIASGTTTFDCDGTSTTAITGSQIPTNDLYMFARNYNGSPSGQANARIYYCKLWNDGVLVRDFIPVRVGTTGYMYDKVSGQLFGNAGTGDFILGNDI